MVGYGDPAGVDYHSTFCHNTLSFSQRNQSGGTGVFDTAITNFLTTSGDHCPGKQGGIDWVIADATAVYPEATKFLRHLIFIRPDVVILFDDVATKQPELMDFNFTCLGPIVEHDNAFISTTKRNRLVILPQSPQQLTHRFSPWGTHWPDIPSHRLIYSTSQPERECSVLTILAPSALLCGITRCPNVIEQGYVRSTDNYTW